MEADNNEQQQQHQQQPIRYAIRLPLMIKRSFDLVILCAVSYVLSGVRVFNIKYDYMNGDRENRMEIW